MSFLVIEILSKGIIFGADRNVTVTHSDGSQNQNEKVEKVLRWPNKKCLVGYVGVGEVGGLSTKEWMEHFIQDNLNFGSLETLAEDLRNRIEQQRRIDEGADKPDAFIIHLGGFEKDEGVLIPKIFFITNIYGLDDHGQYHDFRKEFKCTEEFWKYFPGVAKTDIKSVLETLEKKFEPFWFHQGLDLLTFNILHDNVKNAFRILIQEHPDQIFPDDLAQWEKFVKMQILMYGSYFESFNESHEQYVGGGANICSIEWI